jgi:histidinol-phosphatase (PHP family)
LGDYVAQLRSVAATALIPLRVGVELDWFPSFDDELRAALAPHEFDHIVGSVHEVDGMILDGSPRAWAQLSQAGRDEVHRRYWQSIGQMAASGLFDIAAHLDLSKKFGYLPQVDLSAEIDAALDVIADVDLVVELNTAGWHKPCDDAYPTLDILRGCHRRGITVTLSADAHDPAHLVRDFDRGAERLRAAGFTQIARLAGRERHLVPL